MKNQPDLFVRYMTRTPYIIVCIGLAFLKISEITFPTVIIYVIVYVVCFGALSSLFALFKHKWDPLDICETKNSNVVENGPPFAHAVSIEKQYYENITSWSFNKAFWLSFIITAIIMIVISPYL